MRRVGNDYLITKGSLVGIVISWLAIAGGVSWLVKQSHDISMIGNQNHALICRLDLLFGLDRKPSPAVLKRLRPTQVKALHEIISACPGLQRKGH